MVFYMSTKLNFFLVIFLIILVYILYISNNKAVKEFKLDFISKSYKVSSGYILPYEKFRGYTLPTIKEPFFTIILNTKGLKEKFIEINIQKNTLLDYDFKFIKQIEYSRKKNILYLRNLNIKLTLPKTKVHYNFDLYQNRHKKNLIVIHTISDKFQKGVFAYILLTE